SSAVWFSVVERTHCCVFQQTRDPLVIVSPGDCDEVCPGWQASAFPSRIGCDRAWNNGSIYVTHVYHGSGPRNCEFERNFSGHTVKAYRLDLAQFTRFTVQQGKSAPVAQVDRSLIR